MTDDELLQLVETKSPGELSLDEIQMLRTRLAESAELRATFSSRLRLQTVLAEVLARIDLGPEDVLRANRHRQRAGSSGGRWKWAAMLLIIVAVATVVGVPQLRQQLGDSLHRFTEGAPGEVVDGAAPVQPPFAPAASPDQPDRRDSPVATSTPDDGPPGSALADGESPAPPDAEPIASPATNDDPAAPEASNVASVDAAANAVVATDVPPWQAALDGDPTLPLEDLLFQRFDARKVLPQVADLHQWFDVIVGEPKGIVEGRTRRGQCGAIEGILRLKAPWTDDSLLRLELEKYRHLQIHFFAGNQGVTLAYHADQPERWAAYVTTRTAGRFTPRTWRLTAHDAGRNRRTLINQGGPYQLRHRQGELILSRGDIDLIRAPLEQPPEDVFFQGNALITGIDWQRVALPAIAVADTDGDGAESRPDDLGLDDLAGLNVRSHPAAQLGWQSQLQPEAGLVVLPGKGVRLESNNSPKRSWSTICRPRDDLYFVDLELDNATHGAGIYVGDVANPRWVLRYVRDNRTDQLCLLARGNDDHYEQDFRPLDQAMLPGVGGRHWIRLVYGPSMIRWWLSVDGEHWAEADPLRNPPQNVTQLGLHCVARIKCGVTLHQMRLSPLRAVTLLADPGLRSRVLLETNPANPAAEDLASWMARTIEFQPPDCSLAAWRRAVAVQTLAAGCPAALGTALLDLLLDDGLAEAAEARPGPAADSGHVAQLMDRLDLLDQAALLADLYDDQQRVDAWANRYHRLAAAESRLHGEAAFSLVRAALMRSPLFTVRNFELVRPETIGTKLIRMVYANDWSATAQFCRQVRFFHLDAKVPLFAWAEMAAAKRTPEGLSDELLTRMPETWRNLLIEHQSKDVYNASAELYALLDGEAYEDAAHFIASLDPRELPGVAVDQQDDRLLASLPALMTMAAQRHPQLRAVVAKEQAPLADLRLRERVALPDASGVAMLTLQFPGTSAVAEAHAWLGDRALSSGWFESALWHYRRAAGVGPQSTGTTLDSRMTMATVMLGRDAGADTPPPRLGDVQLKLEELTAIQTHQREELGVGPVRYTANGFAGQHLHTAPPSAFVVHKKARLDGSVGQEPQRTLNGNINVHQVDWANRQLAVALDKQRFYVSNRFQVAAYDRGSGARAWVTAQLPGRVRRAHEWSLTAMRPVLRGDRIYARQLYGDTTSLACFDKSNGQPRWNAIHRQNIDIISDPMFLQDRLVCLTMARTSDLESVVRLTTLDPETGTVWQEHDLVTLSNAWQRRQVCEIQQVRDRLVAVLGGVVVSCDAEGRLQWISRQILLPPDEQPDWVTQTFAPPLIYSPTEIGSRTESQPLDADRIYVTEPGVRVLQCLDVETGRRYWSRTLPDLKRILGFSGGCLVGEGHDRLLGLDPTSGKTRWQQPMEGLLHGHLCGGPQGIVVARRRAVDEKQTKFAPELVWLNGQTGSVTHTTVLDGLDDPDPRLGPMIVSGEHVWTFFGRGPNDANRDVIQLAPNGSLVASVPAAATVDDRWLAVGDVEQRRAIQQRLPDWRLLGGVSASGTGIVPDAHGEKDVLSLAGRTGAPVVLGRWLELPGGTHPRLRFSFGSDVNRAGEIEVRFQGVPVMRAEITNQTHATPWKSIEVDLQNMAGESGWLSVHARFYNGNNPVLVAWKTMDVVF